MHRQGKVALPHTGESRGGSVCARERASSLCEGTDDRQSREEFLLELDSFRYYVRRGDLPSRGERPRAFQEYSSPSTSGN